MSALTLWQLARQCEQAGGEYLDGLIEAKVHIAGHIDLTQILGGVSVTWEADDGPFEGRVSIYIGGRVFKRYRAPRFTSGMEEAMSLAPEGRLWAVMTDALKRCSCRNESEADFRDALPRFIAAAALCERALAEEQNSAKAST
jgi:hypothetical protein